MKTTSIDKIRAALSKAGYAPEVPEESASLVLSIQGLPKTGKTALALSAPGPIAYHALDTGDDGLLQPAVSGGKVIFPMTHSYSLPRELRVEPEFPPRAKDKDGEWRPSEEEIAFYQTRAKWIRENCWQPFEDACDEAVKAGVRSIVWDTATEAWEMKRLSHFGKLLQNPQMFYPKINGEYKEMVRRIKLAGVNLILVHQLKQDFDTKKWMRQGMSKIEYLVDAYVETSYRPAFARGKETVPESFGVTILTARQNMPATGTRLVMDGGPDFMTLASVLKPGVPVESWADGA